VDKEVVDKLENAGIDTSFHAKVLAIPIRVNGNKEPIPIQDEISVLGGEIVVPRVGLKRISKLFTGNVQPPSFQKGPTPEYMWFFLLIEKTAVDFCSCTGRIERDVEFEKLYTQLRRRPDGRDPNPLFSYIQAAARLYMSIRDVSQAEFEGVVSRLARSARAHSMGPTSRNYYEAVSQHVGIG